MLITVDEYLATSFDDGDLEFVNGETVEPNCSDLDHSRVQTIVGASFAARDKELGTYTLISVRTRVSPACVRVPDVVVILGPRPTGRIVTEPPFLIVEVLSPEDRVGRIGRKIDDYLRFGVRFVWSIDPETRNGHIYTADRRFVVENGVYWTDDPRIELNLTEL